MCLYHNDGICSTLLLMSSCVFQSLGLATTRIQCCSLAPLSVQCLSALCKRSTISSRRIKRVIDISTRITTTNNSSVDISVTRVEAILSSPFFVCVCVCEVRSVYTHFRKKENKYATF